MRKFIIYSGLWLVLVACSDERAIPKSQLPTPNRTPMRTTQKFPAVVMVDGAMPCSGVAIAPNAVLTCAHCLSGANLAAVVPSRHIPIRTRAPHYAGFTDAALLILDTDLPANVIDGLPAMARTVDPGDVVTLVGFGDAMGVRRRGYPYHGTNMIYRIGELIELNTPVELAPRGSSNRAAGSKGDSGGALFKEVNGQLELAGLIHAHNPNKEDYTTEAVDVSTAAFQNFLRAAASQFSISISGL